MIIIQLLILLLLFYHKIMFQFFSPENFIIFSRIVFGENSPKFQ
jgi:hypothetical protein